MESSLVQQKVGQPTTHIKNLEGEIVAWDAVKDALLKENLTIKEASARFKIKVRTLYERCRRYGWKPVHATAKAARKELAKKVHDEILKIGADGVIDWTNAGEKHRKTAFKIAHASVAKFKPRAPKNFRELEAADKMARRAAGLENVEIQQNTLIQVNELINEAEPQVTEAQPVEAEIIESQESDTPPPAEQLPPAASTPESPS